MGIVWLKRRKEVVDFRKKDSQLNYSHLSTDLNKIALLYLDTYFDQKI